MTDRLHDTLERLRQDADRTPLAGSDHVRERGDRRTRNQVLGSALAVVAIVVGVVGITGGLGGNDEAANLPAEESSVSTTPEPRASTMDPPVTKVPGSVLLTAEGTGVVTRLAKDNVNASGIATLAGGCLLGNDDLVDGVLAAYGPDPHGQATAATTVLSQEDAAGAARQLAEFRTIWLDGCEARLAQRPGADQAKVAPATLTPVQSGILATLGDGAWAYRIEVPDYTSVVIGLRQANASAVLSFDLEAFTMDEALSHAELTHARMTEVFGA